MFWISWFNFIGGNLKPIWRGFVCVIWETLVLWTIFIGSTQEIPNPRRERERINPFTTPFWLLFLVVFFVQKFCVLSAIVKIINVRLLLILPCLVYSSIHSLKHKQGEYTYMCMGYVCGLPEIILSCIYFMLNNRTM